MGKAMKRAAWWSPKVEPFPGEGSAATGAPGAPPVPPPPTGWDRASPIVVPVGVALAAKVAMLSLTFLVLDRPDDFWHRLAWAWDGEHYIGIARHGYQFRFEGPGDSVHFALLYPMLIRLFGSDAAAALAINNLCGLAAVAVIAWHWGKRAGLAFALFPSWMVFSSVGYSEGLYVLLAATGLAFAERGRLAIGGLAAGIAATARYLGGPALLLAVLPWRAWRQPARWLAFALVAAAGVGLFVWMWYWTGHFLGYYESQKPWGGQVAWPWEHFDWLLHGWFTLQGGAIQAGNLSPVDFVMRDIVFSIPILLGLGLLWQRRATSMPSFVYSLVVFLTAICTSGTPAAALPRYVAVAFPAIAVLGDRVRGPWLWGAYIVAAVAVASHGLAHHLFGYWS